MFPKTAPKIHYGIKDPDGENFEAFEETYKIIEQQLLPLIKKTLEE